MVDEHVTRIFHQSMRTGQWMGSSPDRWSAVSQWKDKINGGALNYPHLPRLLLLLLSSCVLLKISVKEEEKDKKMTKKKKLVVVI